MAPGSFLIRALSDVARALNAGEVDYALAGGLAFSALVEPRATVDVDLLVLLDGPSPEKIQTLFARVFDSIVAHPAPMVFKGMSIWRAVGVREQEEVIVDLLLAQSEFLREALTRKRVVDFMGLPLPIITIEDFIILKAQAARLQDLADLEKIKRQPGLQIDWSYVRTWQAKLGITSI